eukprot:GILJ01001546.1.p1 GENE.GILJ01001546.1~~GILJ01001546.1.p1  ORF type:complete len:161 (+),score=24.59 GILJ01001546.1:51-485(+)
MADEEAEVMVEGLQEETDEQIVAGIQQRLNQVESLLKSGNVAGALNVALSDPPYSTKVQEIKDQNAQLVLKAITSIRETDIEGIISNLTQDQCDVLMKYLYRGWGMASSKNSQFCSQLLRWHAQLTEKAGLGCIVRAMAERRVV